MIKTFSFHSPLSATQLTKVWPLSFIFFFQEWYAHYLRDGAKVSFGVKF